MAVNIKNLTKTFGAHAALSQVSFQIPAGTICGITGPSGSGKSTLLRCIQGLEKPDAGEIACAGLVGTVFQHLHLFPHMTVWQNSLYAPVKTGLLTQMQAEANATELLHIAGLSTKKNCYPHALSGGEKQRVALVRALMMQPALLLLDEPTSALDAGNAQNLIMLLQKNAAVGMGMLVVSHDQAFLQALTKRIIVLEQGIITHDGEI